MRNTIFTVKLLGSQQVNLKEKERADADLLRRLNALSPEKREADERLVKLQADLDTNWWLIEPNLHRKI